MKHPETTKDEKFDRVAEQTLRWIETHGLSKINLSRIAAQSKVSRTWIYKYIGSTQKDWITHAVIHFGAQVGRLNRPETSPGAVRDSRTWHSVSQQSWIELAELAAKYPWLFPLYYRYKNSTNEIGDCIRRIECAVVQRNTQEFMDIFKLPRPRAELAAETVVCVRMALAYQSLNLRSTKSDSRERLLSRISDNYQAMIRGLGLT
jgi:hypothetical protein